MVLLLARVVIFLYLLAIFHLHYFAGKINLQTVEEIFSQNPQPINFNHPPNPPLQFSFLSLRGRVTSPAWSNGFWWVVVVCRNGMVRVHLPPMINGRG